MLVRQRDLHPDKFGSSGERVVSLAKELSGRVNMAYEALADPLKRAEYIVRYLLLRSACTGEG
jgi:molecular chaperone HscB